MLLRLCWRYLHIACMGRSVTIRDVPDAACVELASRAAASGRSLQEYLRMQLIELASRPDPEALVARIRRTQAAYRQPAAG